MSDEEQPPALPGEVWRGEVPGLGLCMVDNKDADGPYAWQWSTDLEPDWYMAGSNGAAIFAAWAQHNGASADAAERLAGELSRKAVDDARELAGVVSERDALRARLAESIESHAALVVKYHALAEAACEVCNTVGHEEAPTVHPSVQRLERVLQGKGPT